MRDLAPQSPAKFLRLNLQAVTRVSLPANYGWTIGIE